MRAGRPLISNGHRVRPSGLGLTGCPFISQKNDRTGLMPTLDTLFKPPVSKPQSQQSLV